MASERLDVDTEDFRAAMTLDRINFLGKGFATQVVVKGTEIWYPGKDADAATILLKKERVQRLIDLKFLTPEAQRSAKTSWRMTQAARTFLEESY
jgi:hypothetical protein